jgi:predicted nucleic acid-binding Zn ribbon protein
MTGREQEPDYGAPKRSRRVDRLLALLIFALILLVLVRVFFR